MRTVTFIQVTQPSAGLEALDPDAPKRAVYVPAEEIVEVLDGHGESVLRTRTGGQIIASEPAGVVVEYIKAALLAEELRNNPTLAGDIQKLCRLVVELRDTLTQWIDHPGSWNEPGATMDGPTNAHQRLRNRLDEAERVVGRYIPRG